MKIFPSQPIQQIAIELKGAVSLFEKYRMPFYPDGERKLGEVCASVGVPFERIGQELEKSETIPALWRTKEPDWEKETMAAVIRYIIAVHHVQTRSILEVIDRELSRLMEMGIEPLRLGVVMKIFKNVNPELRHHMLEEERTVFPFLVFAEWALGKDGDWMDRTGKNKNFTDTIRNILFEHRFMDKGFTEIEKLVFLFHEDVRTEALGLMIEGLKELRDDNQKHIYLENNVLLKRAAQLNLMD